MKRFLITLLIALGLSLILFVVYALYFFASLDHRINEAVAMLPKEELLAHQLGLSLDPAHFQTPLPPTRFNAAMDYEKLTVLLGKHPLTVTQKEALKALDNPSCTPAQVAIACETVAKRSDIMKLVMDGVSKPVYVFKRDWTAGMSMLMPEYGTMTTAAYMIRAKSYLLLKRGQWIQAIQTQSIGFKLARQVEEDPLLTALRFGLMDDYISLEGMQMILRKCGSNPAALEMIQSSIAQGVTDLNVKHALRGDFIVMLAIYNSLPTMNAKRINKDFGNNANLHPGGNPYLNASLAITLKEMLTLYQAECMKPIDRQRELQKASDSVSMDMDRAAKNHDALWVLPLVLLTDVSRLELVGKATFTERNVLQYSVATLEYHVKHGSFPVSLDKIAPDMLHPAMGNPATYQRTKSGFLITGASKPMDIHNAHIYFEYP